MLTCFAFNVVHIGLKLVIAFVCQSTALDNYRHRSMPTVFKVIVIQIFSLAASVNIQRLTNPANLTVRSGAEFKLQYLISPFVRIQLRNISACFFIHNAFVSELLEIHGFTTHCLLILSVPLFTPYGFSFVNIFNLNRLFKQSGFFDAGNVFNEFDLYHFVHPVSDYLQICSSISFTGGNNLLKNFFCITVQCKKFHNI